MDVCCFGSIFLLFLYSSKIMQVFIICQIQSCLIPDNVLHIFSLKQVTPSQHCTYNLKNILRLHKLGAKKQDVNYECYLFPSHNTATYMALVSFYIIYSRDTFLNVTSLDCFAKISSTELPNTP